MQCHSFRIRTEAGSLLYSADIADFQEIVPLLEGLDYVVVESTHIDLEMLLDHVRTSDIREYVLTHLGSDAEVAALEQKIRRAGITKVRLASDGLRLPL